MYKVTYKVTGETTEHNTMEDVNFYIKLAVAVTNDRINKGILKAKRISRKSFTITEI